MHRRPSRHALARWPGLLRLRDWQYIKTQRRWKCGECRRQFSVKVGTILEDSPVSLTKWLPTLWLLCDGKNGVSSYEIHRDLDVTQKTAWFMLHWLRLVLKDGLLAKLSGGPIEVDETWVGGMVRFALTTYTKTNRAKRRCRGYDPFCGSGRPLRVSQLYL